jgi:hypothetical protein
MPAGAIRAREQPELRHRSRKPALLVVWLCETVYALYPISSRLPTENVQCRSEKRLARVAQLTQLGALDRQGVPGRPAGVHSLRQAHVPAHWEPA